MATYLQVVELHGVAELPPATRALYDVHANTASFGTEPEFVSDRSHLDFELTTEGHHLSFELVDEPAPGALMARELALPSGEYLLRCDRVDFEPGGIAPPHRHRGGGIRCLLRGRLEVTVADGAPRTVQPGEAWFESGREPVLAVSAGESETSFIRFSIHPAAIRGQSSILYVDPADAGRGRPRRYTVYVDEPIAL